MKQTGRSGAGVWLFRGGVLLGGIVSIGGSAQPEAFAQEASPTKAECARAYESSQESRAAGQLKDTIEKLAVCARPECPGFVQKDCSRWLEEVEGELPSVLVQ
ncbi:MAG TPA: hypothetical protein VNN80_12770, partial [Polyangiaceae bacterium]|nr:hypothetical protein [Polyangiaceae bacterium]